MKKQPVNSKHESQSPLDLALSTVSELDRLEPTEVDDLLDLEPELLNMLGLRIPTLH